MEQVQILNVTPEIAARLLAHNTSNRNVRPGGVARFRAILDSDRYLLGPDAIAMTGTLASPGEIVNGQHRLMGVCEAKRSARMVVLTGCDPAVFLICDRGIKRSTADALRRMGIPNAAQMSAVGSVILAYQAGSSTRSRGFKRPDSDEVAEFVAGNSDLPGLVSRWLGLRDITSQPATVIAAAVLHSVTNPDDAVVFWTAVATGEMLSAGNPALTLRNRLLINQRAKDVRIGEMTMLALCIKASRAHMEGRTLGVLKLLDTEDMPLLPGCRFNPSDEDEATAATE